MKAVTILTGLALAVGLFAQDAAARVIVKERTTYYNVSGKTGPALFASIGKRGPKVRARHAIATTTSQISVKNFTPEVKGRRCRVKRVDVIVDITYRYPRWNGSKRANPAVRKAWDNFMKKVRQHEGVHGQIAKDHARDVEKTLRAMSGRTSRNCSDFGRYTDRSLLRAGKRAERRHRALDRRDSRFLSRNARLQRALYRAQ